MLLIPSVAHSVTKLLQGHGHCMTALAPLRLRTLRALYDGCLTAIVVGPSDNVTTIFAPLFESALVCAEPDPSPGCHIPRRWLAAHLMNLTAIRQMQHIRKPYLQARTFESSEWHPTTRHGPWNSGMCTPATVLHVQRSCDSVVTRSGMCNPGVVTHA